MSFQRHAEIVASALSICERMYEGALGQRCSPSESRIATDPLAVLSDMQNILLEARQRILKFQIEEEL